MIPQIVSLTKSNLSKEELLISKKELCEDILKCDEHTAEKYFLKTKGFPYVEIGSRRKYPRKQIETWIAENTHFN